MRKFGDKRLGQIKKIEDDASIFFLLSDKRGSNPRFLVLFYCFFVGLGVRCLDGCGN